MSILFWKAYWNLFRFDWFLVRRDFGGLRNKVRNQPSSGLLASPQVVERICSAIDMASIWYWKEVLCLQRSAATASLLKCYGVDAKLAIGAQQLPFKAHAWVELNGRVLNDRPYMREIYTVLDLC